MSKPVYSLDLSPRENRHVAPSLAKDVWFVVQLGLLALLGYVILMLVMAL